MAMAGSSHRLNHRVHLIFLFEINDGKNKAKLSFQKMATIALSKVIFVL